MVGKKVIEFLDPEQILHPYLQFCPINGFGQEFFRSCLQPFQARCAIIQRGNHDDRDGAGARVCLEPPRYHKTINAGHHDIEQDEVWQFRCD